jgi:hypothetical protein
MFVVITSSPVMPLTRLADRGIIATIALMMQWQQRRMPRRSFSSARRARHRSICADWVAPVRSI